MLATTFAIGCSKKAAEAPADDSSDDGAADDSSAMAGAGGDGGDGGAGGFGLSSPTIAGGSTFPIFATCAGANYSPALSFAGVPPNTQSIAILLIDQTNDLVHWALWDIPVSLSGLPAAITAAPNPPEIAPAKQTKSYDGTTWGYLGPCPGGATHTYQFTIAAEDVATLPDLESTSARDDVRAAVLAHAIGTATLTATSDASSE